MPSSPPGLRERKRLEVRARIEEAAVFLVLRDGLVRTTVDAISERADVSPRTFFNHFDSKDGAILGLHPQQVVDRVVAEQMGRDDGAGLVESVVRLLMVVSGAPLTGPSTTQVDRFEVLKRHPEVISGQFVRPTTTAQLVSAVEVLLGRHEPSVRGARASGDRRAEAEVVLAACGGAIRAVVHDWATRATASTEGDIERRAVALVASTLRRLA